MDELFERKKIDRKAYSDYIRTKRMALLQVMLVIAVFVFSIPGVLAAEERQTVAVLPFRIHTLTSLDHLKTGLQEMLTLRIAEKGFYMIGPEVINRHPLAFSPQLEKKELVKLGKALEADWIVLGSATEVGRKVSLDLEVVDVSEVRPSFFLFMVSEDIDSLAETMKRVSVSIDNQISGVVQVDSLMVRGSHRIEKEAVLAMVKTRKGDKLDYGLLDKDLRNIYKMGFFKDISIETEDGPKGKIVIFNVVEKPSIGKIVFDGNKQIDDDDLRKEVGIKTYSILDNNEIRQGINRIKELYRKKGYYNAEIKENVESIPNNEVLVKYEIKENDKVFITKIEFLGNTKFDDDDLKDIMETSQKGFFGWFSWFTDWGYLDKKKLEFDAHKLTSFYHNQGFIKAKVGDPKIMYEKDKGLTITFEIVEGPQYGVKEVAVEGDLIKPAEELLKKVQIGNQEVFNREVVREDILALRGECVDEGYAYAEVVPRVTEDEESHVVDITYHISKGKKVRFERINVSGNVVTRDKVIRRELKVIEGEDFSGQALRRSTENLNRLGFFEDVEVQTKKGSQDDLMVLDIKVKERATGSFSVGAGYSSEDSAFVMFQVAQNNLFGNGQKLDASVKLGAKTTSYDISFVEPWFLDKPISFGIDVYKWEHEYDDYTRDSLGGAVTFGTLVGIDDFTRGFVTYDYDNALIDDIREDASYAIKEMEGRNITSSMTFVLKRDSRDKPWNTTKGSINSMTFQYAGGILSGDQYFNKYVLRSAWFFPLFWKTVFLVQGRWGLIRQRSGGELFTYQKFMIGGMNTVRGFDYASISPIDPATGDKIGGTKMMVYNVEYRFPLLKEQGIVGLVFFDAGNVFESQETITLSGIRRSAGCGIRWYSPMGPLRLEYGKNLDKRPGEAGGKWEFSIGGTF